MHVADARRSRRRRRAGRGRGRTRPARSGVSSSAAPKRCARQGSGHSSLITTGTPCRGPAGPSASISRERSGKVSTTALIAGLRSSIRASVASSSSPGSASPAAIAAACSRRERSSSAHRLAAPSRGRDRARARPRRGRARAARGSRGQKSCVGGAHHGQLDLVGLDPERGEAGRDEIVCCSTEPPFRLATLHEAAPGRDRASGARQRRISPARGRQNRRRNPGSERRGLQLRSLLQQQPKTRLDGARAVARSALACLLAALVVVAWPGAADSAPLRVVVLGKTAETPPPSCPGKIVNNVEVIPCRVEGHVTGFQVDRRRRRRAPTRRPSTARSSPGRSRWPSPRATDTENDHRRGRLLQRLPRRALAGADRRPAPGRGLEAAEVQARPPEPAGAPQPLLRQHPDLRPRAPADRAPRPGRRPDDPDLGADVRLQRLRRQHLARQPPPRPLLLARKTSRAATPSRASAKPRPTAATTPTPACSTRRRWSSSRSATRSAN